jgi:hypothetical protein
MNIETLVSTVIGVIAGGAITWLVSWYYYKKAADELNIEAKQLKLTSDLIMYKLQYPETPTEIIRDEKGNVIGLKAFMSTKK